MLKESGQQLRKEVTQQIADSMAAFQKQLTEDMNGRFDALAKLFKNGAEEEPPKAPRT